MVLVGFPRQKKASANRKCRQAPRFTAFSQRFTAISIHGANCLVSFQRCASARCPHAVMTRMSSGNMRIRVKTFNRRIENRLLRMSTSKYPILLLPVLSKCDTWLTRLSASRGINDTQGHKNFSFCEQTLHKGLIDAFCDWLQYTTKNRGQNNFLRKSRAKIQFLRLLFPSLRSISSYNPHTILKNARQGRIKTYIYFYLQKLQVGPGDAACRERQYATKNMARTNFLRKIWRINPGFRAPDQRSYSQIFKIVCTSSKFNTFHANR